MTLAIFIPFVLFVHNCFAIGFAIDCYGPGCGNDACDKAAFTVFAPFYVIFFLILFPVHWLWQIAFNWTGISADTAGFLITYALMCPVFYVCSILLIKLAENLSRKWKTKKISPEK